MEPFKAEDCLNESVDGLVGVIGFIRRECAPPPFGGPDGAGGGGRSEVALLKLCRSDGCSGSWFLDGLLLFSNLRTQTTNGQSISPII